MTRHRTLERSPDVGAGGPACRPRPCRSSRTRRSARGERSAAALRTPIRRRNCPRSCWPSMRPSPSRAAPVRETCRQPRSSRACSRPRSSRANCSSASPIPARADRSAAALRRGVAPPRRLCAGGRGGVRRGRPGWPVRRLRGSALLSVADQARARRGGCAPARRHTAVEGGAFARRPKPPPRIDIDPTSDIHASSRYRRQLAAVLIRRVLERAFLSLENA